MAGQDHLGHARIPSDASDTAIMDFEPLLTPGSYEGTSPTESPFGAPSTVGSTTPHLSRNPSFSADSSFQEDWDALPPTDRLSVLDLLDNFALAPQLEKLQQRLSAQTERVRSKSQALRNKSQVARERMVDQWRRRVPSADEQLDRYRRRMRASVEQLSSHWNDTKSITLREKISFIFGVLNIFASGYLIGGYPEVFHLWYTVQILYFMPIRFYTYHARGYHYFLADLCYFVNLLLLLSIWVFPDSKRLFTAVFCLAFGNNAVAIIMWRNSLVFHSFDKVTSLFIHIMPCATLHCLVHLLPPDLQATRHPALYAIRTAAPGSPAAYANTASMLAWSTLPYAVWQTAYYLLISRRRRDKIAAGLRPTSFTWLRRSYSKVWLGRWLLSLPDAAQEPAFMVIQYAYAVLTMLPCPLWFWSRAASAGFLGVVFAWSVWNGSSYYIDVFGKRFQRELEAMKAEVGRWQPAEEGAGEGKAERPGPGVGGDGLVAAATGTEGVGGRLGGWGRRLRKAEWRSAFVFCCRVDGLLKGCISHPESGWAGLVSFFRCASRAWSWMAFLLSLS